MAKTDMPLPSATMALDALREQCDTVRDLEAQLKAARALRDDLIRDCRAVRVPYPFLGKVTKLTRDRLADIVSSGTSRVSHSE